MAHEKWWSQEAIRKVESEYRKHDFMVLGAPDRYRMHDSLMYDTSYHLNKTGVDYRTELLIEDLKIEKYWIKFFWRIGE